MELRDALWLDYQDVLAAYAGFTPADAARLAATDYHVTLELVVLVDSATGWGDVLEGLTRAALVVMAERPDVAQVARLSPVETVALWLYASGVGLPRFERSAY